MIKVLLKSSDPHIYFEPFLLNLRKISDPQIYFDPYVY